MNRPEQPPVARPSTAAGRVAFVAGLVSLVLVLGGSLVTVGLSAAGIGDASDGCLPSDQPRGEWPRYTSLLMLAGIVIAVLTLIAGRRVPFVLRLPAMITAGCAIPVVIVATMFAFITYGGEC